MAFRHIDDEDPETCAPLIVTASIDRIKISHRANLRDDIIANGRVTWVGRSSVELMMSLTASWTEEPWLVAYFTFVFGVL